MNGIDLYKHMEKMAKSLAKRVSFITGDTMAEDTMANTLNRDKHLGVRNGVTTLGRRYRQVLESKQPNLIR